MTLQVVSGGQVCGFTPKGINYARPILALHLVKNWPLPDIGYWLPPTDARVTNLQDTQSPILAKCLDTIPSTGILVPTRRTRPHLPRRVKADISEVEVAPMPQGRKIYSIGIQTYIANSTISDDTKGIDAGHGLFASRTFRSDNTRINDDLVAYYEGTTMSMLEVDIAQTRPDPNRPIGFILVFKGLAIDGWDHINNTHAGPGAAINDFLDERNNCYVDKELIDDDNDDDGEPRIKRKSKKKSGSYRLAIRVDSDKVVHPHEEFGFPYGEFAFCDQALHIEVLLKAARYYYGKIMSEGIERWSRVPQARYLFNTPYHGAAP